MKKIIKQEGLIEVTKTVLGQGTTKKEKIKIRPFCTDVMMVGCKLGATINTGNFENVKVDIFISAPCYAEEATVMLDQVLKLAHIRMGIEVQELKNG